MTRGALARARAGVHETMCPSSPSPTADMSPPPSKAFTSAHFQRAVSQVMSHVTAAAAPVMMIQPAARAAARRLP